MINSLISKKRLVLILSCLVVAGSLSGCASLRKKFTRTKKTKDQKEEFIPVLEPVEYPKVVETPRQIYHDQYGMVKVYFRELLDVLGKPAGGEKREKYIFAELISHFDKMSEVLSEPAKAQAVSLRERLAKISSEYDKPSGLRRYDLMTSDVRAIERDVYRILKPDAVLKSLPASS